MRGPTSGTVADDGGALQPPRWRWWAWLGWAVAALFVIGVVAMVATGANEPADPYLESPTVGPRFGTVAFRIVGGERQQGRAAPTSTERCALLAESREQLARGLMGRRHLGGYDGMVFRFAADHEGAFYMRNVPVPLSIAWFDAEGRFVSSADMAPCEDREGCPRYFATAPYRYAIEVPGGGLGRLGIGPGSVLELGGGCTAG